MIYKKFLFIIVIALPAVFYSCSASKEIEEETKQLDVYVFDQIPADTASVNINPVGEIPSIPIKQYFVQIGAFSTEQAANEFAERSKITLNRAVKVIFNPQVNLFVVRLEANYEREEAENIRNTLWKIKGFEDAFIVTIEK